MQDPGRHSQGEVRVLAALSASAASFSFKASASSFVPKRAAEDTALVAAAEAAPFYPQHHGGQRHRADNREETAPHGAPPHQYQHLQHHHLLQPAMELPKKKSLADLG
eukprot:CAMPEP_0181350732 /NCGR_PEP_ID=MMETSP1106-20121128/1419_1 /TAXON_ID=81844 /ORGANISM="Mantoniella antarctica, Strain SL-175" /LENGTH=107 /DNA_ID=CAMNT_0023463217 /DNA_START=395 /DNA_END=714 /DNA_ORIENTATION=-